MAIPNGVTEIGWNTFYGCKSLKKVSLPRALKGKIDEKRIFRACADGLKVVYQDDTSPKGAKEMLQVCRQLQTAMESGNLDAVELRKLRERQRELLLTIQAEHKKERMETVQQ